MKDGRRTVTGATGVISGITWTGGDDVVTAVFSKPGDVDELVTLGRDACVALAATAMERVEGSITPEQEAIMVAASRQHDKVVAARGSVAQDVWDQLVLDETRSVITMLIALHQPGMQYPCSVVLGPPVHPSGWRHVQAYESRQIDQMLKPGLLEAPVHGMLTQFRVFEGEYQEPVLLAEFVSDDKAVYSVVLTLPVLETLIEVKRALSGPDGLSSQQRVLLGAWYVGRALLRLGPAVLAQQVLKLWLVPIHRIAVQVLEELLERLWGVPGHLEVAPAQVNADKLRRPAVAFKPDPLRIHTGSVDRNMLWN